MFYRKTDCTRKFLIPSVYLTFDLSINVRSFGATFTAVLCMRDWILGAALIAKLGWPSAHTVRAVFSGWRWSWGSSCQGAPPLKRKAHELLLRKDCHTHFSKACVTCGLKMHVIASGTKHLALPPKPNTFLNINNTTFMDIFRQFKAEYNKFWCWIKNGVWSKLLSCISHNRDGQVKHVYGGPDICLRFSTIWLWEMQYGWHTGKVLENSNISECKTI